MIKFFWIFCGLFDVCKGSNISDDPTEVASLISVRDNELCYFVIKGDTGKKGGRGTAGNAGAKVRLKHKTSKILSHFPKISIKWYCVGFTYIPRFSFLLLKEKRVTIELLNRSAISSLQAQDGPDGAQGDAGSSGEKVETQLSTQSQSLRTIF